MKLRCLTTGLIFTATSLSALPAFAVSCMVMGEASAKVQTSDGEKSPVFLSNACESLRLVSGKAMVSWVARDGKPHFSPIRTNGAEGLPVAGSEERSANVVWAELTSKREADRPAFMRALDAERPARVYIPPEGLLLIPKVGADFRVLTMNNSVESVVLEKKSGGTAAIRLRRDQIRPGEVYVLEWRLGDTVENWRWKALDESEMLEMDQKYKQIQDGLADDSQRRIMTAMFYEQLKLRLNVALLLNPGS
jgi:hypothetical protein